MAVRSDYRMWISQGPGAGPSSPGSGGRRGAAGLRSPAQDVDCAGRGGLAGRAPSARHPHARRAGAPTRSPDLERETPRSPWSLPPQAPSKSRP